MATYGHQGGYAFNQDQRDSMREPPATVEFSPREVIEEKLLQALEEAPTVAIILTEHDCDVLLGCLRRDMEAQKAMSGDDPRFDVKTFPRLNGLADGLQRLRDGAFGPK